MKKDVYQRRARKPFPWTRYRERTVEDASEAPDAHDPLSPEQQEKIMQALRTQLRDQARRQRRIGVIAVLVGIPITLLILWMVLHWVNWVMGGKWSG